MKIAVTGKGGVGKTTLSSTLARLYADEGRTVLAADVDPDANLGLALGLTEEEVNSIVPIAKMKELAKEYAGKITIYKVNVDKEQELAALFNATSIPLFVLIPLKEQPQLMRGAADKATYKKAIDEFLLRRP